MDLHCPCAVMVERPGERGPDIMQAGPFLPPTHGAVFEGKNPTRRCRVARSGRNATGPADHRPSGPGSLHGIRHRQDWTGSSERRANVSDPVAPEGWTAGRPAR